MKVFPFCLPKPAVERIFSHDQTGMRMNRIFLSKGSGRVFSAGWGLVALSLLLCGCNTVSTRDLGMQSSPCPTQAPESVSVRDFNVADADLQSGLPDEDGAKLRTTIVKKLSADLATALGNAKVAPRVSTDEEGWLVTGQIRVLALADSQTVAIHPDAAKNNRIETTVFIYDLKQSRSQPFYTFRVTGRKPTEEAAKPELQTDPGQSEEPLSVECHVTADLIASTLSDYLKQRGLAGN